MTIVVESGMHRLDDSSCSKRPISRSKAAQQDARLTLPSGSRRAQGMRIVDAKKSKYYEAALSNFENAMRCFERAGLTDQWAETVNDIRSRHHRKSGFMAGFERLLAGSGPSDEPSFLDRAKARWSRRETEVP